MRLDEKLEELGCKPGSRVQVTFICTVTRDLNLDTRYAGYFNRGWEGDWQITSEGDWQIPEMPENLTPGVMIKDQNDDLFLVGRDWGSAPITFYNMNLEHVEWTELSHPVRVVYRPEEDA